MKYKKPTFIVAFILIITFLFLYFSAILPQMNVYLSFSICLLIGVICLILGVYSLAKRQSTPISIFIIAISIIILLFTLFAYLLPEAGYPPLIEL